MSEKDEEAKKAKEAETKHYEETVLMDLKMKKSRCKSNYTRIQNKLREELELDEDEIDRNKCKVMLDKVDEALENVMQALHELGDFYKSTNRTKEMIELHKEIDEAERKYEIIVEHYQKCLSDSASVSEGHEPEEHESKLGSDLWKQLKRVSIPTFYGDKAKYPAWKAAFYSCVDKSPSSEEYKMLQLRQYLGGAALDAIENLGHSAFAYTAAKERLERKFGGANRIVNKFLDDLEQFPVIKNENAKELERFADLLDIAVINLKEAKQEKDLANGSLYHRLMKKLPQSMLTRYHRQIHEKDLEESVETLKNWVNEETEYIVKASELIHGISIQPKSTRESGQNTSKKEKSFFVSNKDDSNECPICKQNHKVWDCETFKKMDVEARWNKAKEARLCFRCLKQNHLGKKCRFEGKCKINGCEKTHNRLLHRESHLNATAPSYEPQQNSTRYGGENYNTNTNSGQYIALRTIPIKLKYGNREMKVNALLDDGSTKSYLNEDVALEMGLKGTESTVNVNVINGKTETFRTSSVEFVIENETGALSQNMVAQTIKNVTGNLKPIDWKKHANNWPHLQGINFPTLSRKSKIDLLIGLDYADLHRSLGELHGEQGEPIARLTPLGWTCVGPMETKETCHFTFNVVDCHSDRILQKFWEIEKIGTETDIKMSKKDAAILQEAEQTITKAGERYQVQLPWKKDPSELPDNYHTALKRLESTERKLEKSPTIKEIYSNTISDYVGKGYVQKVEKKEAGPRWLLPHFPVIRLNKETTKVRIVFDASAKHSGVSLNDVLEEGPKLQNSLFDVLMRFRKNKIALACDIKEMYLRVGVIPTDRRYNRFLWRANPDDEPDEYEFTRLVFGVSSSPFLAQMTSRHNAKLYSDEFPRAAETVIKSTYMDDSMDSVDTTEEAVDLYNQLVAIWSKAGMCAHKWLSNSKEVIQQIPIEDRALKIDLTKDELPRVKTLGVLWEAESDLFRFEYNEMDLNCELTKRNYLKKIATLFDPLGLLAPYIVTAKLLMQDIWVSGIDWDEKIKDETLVKISDWFEELPKVSQIEIPRCLQNEENLKQRTIHAFSDASEKAYGAAVYSRDEYENGEVTVRLIAAKTKVAPLTAISIPRLELMASLVSLELTATIIEALEIDISMCTFWTDSMDVVYWLRNQSRVFKPFVANRVSEIQRQTNPSQWRHIPGDINPADLLSRGVKVEQLKSKTLWWEGPEFLKSDAEQWPETKIKHKLSCDREMRKSEKSVVVDASENYNTVEIQKIDQNKSDTWRLDPDRFSDWRKIKRVMAWVLRFIENCGKDSTMRKVGPLTCDEMKESGDRLIRDAQKKEFSEYKEVLSGKSLGKKSKLLPLNPIIDSDGIMRCNSRLKNADFMSFDSKFPIILPKRSSVTRLIVKETHEKSCHAGTNYVLAKLSTKFWIIHAREVIREVETECRVCKKQKAKPITQIMAPLPVSRLGGPMKAFSNISVDYGGPFFTKQGRGKTRQKRYLCLFTCLATRAVHLEMAYSLDTNSFLNAFFRMVSRRGRPVKVLSDNGTNFIGADKELKMLVKDLDKSEIISKTSDTGIEWQFNPPLAPHWGGVHEIMIKAAKRAVYRILNSADVTDEELTTAFVGAEALINSRPLTYQSSNPADCEPLTPNHFLFGQIGGEFAPSSVDNTSFDPRNRWRRVQELMRHFWQRWLKEWLPSLSGRKKWFTEQRDLQVGDVVLVVSVDLPRGQWPLGRIVNVFPGSDGHVRSARVLVRGKEIDRPITKLCPLECEQ